MTNYGSPRWLTELAERVRILQSWNKRWVLSEKARRKVEEISCGGVPCEFWNIPIIPGGKLRCREVKVIPLPGCPIEYMGGKE